MAKDSKATKSSKRRTKVKDLPKKGEKLAGSKLKKVKGGAPTATNGFSMTKPVYEWIE